jgi:aspartyl-tRNA(Asn)/glutamyl-tRNA(Gln) amidotransferase subunit B
MYFPDPDLVPMAPCPEWVEAIRASLPELPYQWRYRLTSEHQLSPAEADALVATGSASYYQAVVDLGVPPKQASSLVMGPLTGEANPRGVSIYELPVQPAELAALAEFDRSPNSTASMTKSYLHHMAETGQPFEWVRRKHPMAKVGAGELGPIVDQALADNPKAAEDYRAGKDKAKGAIVGAVMRATKGQADPATLNRLIDERLRPGG